MKKLLTALLTMTFLFAKGQSFNANMSLSELKAVIEEQLETIKYNQETYAMMLSADRANLNKINNGRYYTDNAKEYEKLVLNAPGDIKKMLLENFKQIKYSSSPAIPYTSFKFSNPASPTNSWSNTDRQVLARGLDIKTKKVFFRDGTSEELDEKGRGAYQKNLKTIDSVMVGLSINIPMKSIVVLLNEEKRLEENSRKEYIKLLLIHQNTACLEITEGIYQQVLAVYGIDKLGKRIKSRHFQSLREPTVEQVKRMTETSKLLEDIREHLNAGKITPEKVVKELNAKLPAVPYPKDKRTTTFYFPRDITAIEYVYTPSFDTLYREVFMANSEAPRSPFNIVKDEKPNPTQYGIVDALDGTIVVKPAYYNIEHVEGLIYKVQNTKDENEVTCVLVPLEGTFRKLVK